MKADFILEEYLCHVDAALADVSPDERHELIDRLREHYQAASGDLDEPSTEARSAILRSLGPPDVIAREMREQSRLADARFEGPAVRSRVPSELSRRDLWIPFALAILWPIGFIGVLKHHEWSSVDRWLVSALAAIGPIVYFVAFLSPSTFVASPIALPRMLSHILWPMLSIGGLFAGLIVLSMPVRGMDSRSIAGVRIVVSVAWAFVVGSSALFFGM